jgi:hypothetical protein
MEIPPTPPNSPVQTQPLDNVKHAMGKGIANFMKKTNETVQTVVNLEDAMQKRLAYFNKKRNETEQSVAAIQPLATVIEEPNDVPFWITGTLKALPNMVSFLNLPIAPQTTKQMCSAMQLFIGWMIKWMQNPIIFVWLLFQLLASLILPNAFAMPILIFIHGAILGFSGVHNFLLRYKTHCVNLLRQLCCLETYLTNDIVTRVKELLAEYRSPQDTFRLPLINQFLLRPLSKSCTVAECVPYILYMSSMNLMLVNSGVFGYNWFWLLQLASCLLIDFIPTMALGYVIFAQLLIALSFLLDSSYQMIVISCALCFLCKEWFQSDYNGTPETAKARGILLAQSYGNFILPYCLLGFIGTALWTSAQWESFNGIVTMQLVMGVFWFLMCAVGTKLRSPIIPTFPTDVPKIKLIVLFATLPFAMQYCATAIIHGFVAFWFLPDLIQWAGQIIQFNAVLIKAQTY